MLCGGRCAQLTPESLLRLAPALIGSRVAALTFSVAVPQARPAPAPHAALPSAEPLAAAQELADSIRGTLDRNAQRATARQQATAGSKKERMRRQNMQARTTKNVPGGTQVTPALYVCSLWCGPAR